MSERNDAMFSSGQSARNLLLVLVLVTVGMCAASFAQVSLNQISTFQQGRFFTGGGSSDIGWATSLDGGNTWQHGSLPGLSKIEGSGPYDRVTDPAVTYDAAHGMWLIASLPLSESGKPVPPMLISRSADGITWNNPIVVASNFTKPDKTWVNCDSNTGSKFYGNCYAEWDDNGNGDLIWLSTSSDGGLTWSAPQNPQGSPIGLGGQPMAKPNGGVIVTSSDAFLTSLISYTSRNGGQSWGPAATIAFPVTHANSGGLRDLNLPSAAIDSRGRVFVAWHDCSFRSGCSSNDIVISTSRDGATWLAPRRVPIDDTTSTVDHFLPGLEVEPGTGGATAHLGLTYYFYPQANCSSSTCQLMEGYISSPDGGNTWTTPVTLAGPMKVTDAADTDQGFMVGDYQSVSFVDGKAFPGIAVANPKSGSTFNEAMYSPVTGLLSDIATRTSDHDKPVPNAHSDHLPPVLPAWAE